MSRTILEVNELYFKNILNNINFSAQAGDFIVLLGHNGCGKSTLLSMINRQQEKTQGEIRLNNNDITTYNKKTYAKEVSSIHQDPNKHLCLSLTIMEHLKLYLMLTKKQRINLKNTSEIKEYLQSFHPKLPNYLNKSVETLSGGEKQMLILALHLLLKPKLLLLDEHTSALDPQSRSKIISMTDSAIKKHQVTCIMTTHDLSIATQYGNRIIVMRDGKIHNQFNNTEKNKLSPADLYHSCY